MTFPWAKTKQHGQTGGRGRSLQDGPASPLLVCSGGHLWEQLCVTLQHQQGVASLCALAEASRWSLEPLTWGVLNQPFLYPAHVCFKVPFIADCSDLELTLLPARLTGSHR